jgi:hypothetical protein
VKLTGYIDESISNGQHLFAMSALIAERSDWVRFEVDWKDCIKLVNRRLEREGRQQISRYHASDCSSRIGDFNGWTREEQIDLTKQLLNTFQSYNTKAIAFIVDLDAIAEFYPGGNNDRLSAAYDLLTAYLVREAGEWLDRRNNTAVQIDLIHDHCAYNHAIQNSFQSLMSHSKFKYQSYFGLIKPSSWRDCTLLQAADLLAFESMKEAERQTAPRNRRKTLRLLLDLESFGIRAEYLNREKIYKISTALSE